MRHQDAGGVWSNVEVAIDKTSLAQKIRTELSGLNVNNSKDLFEASKRIQHAFLQAALPEYLKNEIKWFFKDYANDLIKSAVRF